MMNVPCDIATFIISFLHMRDQLLVSPVCHEWKRLVDRHPLLLNDIDFGDPERFSVCPVDSVLDKASSRVRSLRICTFYLFDVGKPLRMVSNVVELVQKVVKTLLKLILVGHVHPTHLGFEALMAVLKASNAPFLELTLETCPCSLNVMEARLSEINHDRCGAVLSLSSPHCISFPTSSFLCGCGSYVRWVRPCLYCSDQRLVCSECSYFWDWAPELSPIACECSICMKRTYSASIQHLIPPLWCCSIHCCRDHSQPSKRCCITC